MFTNYYSVFHKQLNISTILIAFQQMQTEEQFLFIILKSDIVIQTGNSDQMTFEE